MAPGLSAIALTANPVLLTCIGDDFHFEYVFGRQMAAEMLSDAEILVYLTQDAILSSPEAASNLVAAFRVPRITVAYGPQLPRAGANAIEESFISLATVDVVRCRLV